MTAPKLNKDQIQKIVLSAMGFVFLLYAYFAFFLGPLNRSRDAAMAKMMDKQGKLSHSKDELAKTASLEQHAKTATTRFAAFKALSLEGAPIAWFPPRIKSFFASRQIDKAGVRLDNTGVLKEPELSAWQSYVWLIELPQSDYESLGKAIAELENSEPLLEINRVSIRGLTDEPQFQQTSLAVTTYIPKQ